jgi:hypothetical protein
MQSMTTSCSMSKQKAIHRRAATECAQPQQLYMPSTARGSWTRVTRSLLRSYIIQLHPQRRVEAAWHRSPCIYVHLRFFFVTCCTKFTCCLNRRTTSHSDNCLIIYFNAAEKMCEPIAKSVFYSYSKYCQIFPYQT